MSSSNFFPMNSSIYKYYPTKDDKLQCIVCQYEYRKDAPLSTLQKHLRAKHGFSIRCPLSPQELQDAIEIARAPVFFLYQGPAVKSPKPPKSAKTEGPVIRFDIKHILNSNPKEFQTNPVHVEEHLIKWILKDKIPLAIATSDSFFDMLRGIHPEAILPTKLRVYQLIHDEFQTIMGNIQSPDQSSSENMAMSSQFAP